MNSMVIRGAIRNGRVETEEPVNLPDGTRLLISVQPSEMGEEEGWDVSPQGVADWIKWCESLQPLTITPQEQADTESWLKKLNDHDSVRRDKDIEDLFP